MSSEGLFNNKMFFIVGRGRSGTTLLSYMLDAHPDLSVAPEAVFIMNLRRKYADAKWTKKTILSFYEDLWLEKRLEAWKIHREQLRTDLLSLEGEQVSFSDLCKAIYIHHAVRSGKKPTVLLGDKNPHYSLFLKELTELYPEAKIIYIVRDYRDNILSYKKMRFDVKNTAALAYRWAAYNLLVLKQRALFPHKFLLLRFEDLLADPESQLRNICDFLNIDYMPSMLEFYKNPDRNVRPWHANLKTPINVRNMNRWEKNLPKGDIEQADYICARAAALLGYAPHADSKRLAVSFRSLWGRAYGRLITFLEKAVFSLPLRVRSAIITYYRFLTGSLK